ncbi:MAG: hypothetical protein LUD68_00365, partial [Rikenellaceae bacterium]|nr:hypothetical protein [Rikenellaceae bacterium]
SLNYLYRVNCGGDTFIDQNHSVWMADRHRSDSSGWGSRSWADDFPGIPPYFGSQRRTFDPVKNAEWYLFQTFRYGTDKLRYEFPVPDGEYTVELYFMEPWYGRDIHMNCKGWRMFDVAVNDQTVIRDLDIWSFRGANTAIRQRVKVQVTGGLLTVHFPHVSAGQAVVSAIAIATENRAILPSEPSPGLVTLRSSEWDHRFWMSTGDQQFLDHGTTLAHLPPELHGAEWLKGHRSDNFRLVCEVNQPAWIYLMVKRSAPKLRLLNRYEKLEDFVQNGEGQFFDVYRKTAQKGEKLTVNYYDAQFLGGAAFTHIPDMGEEPSTRPVLKFEAEDLPVTGAVERGHFRNSDFVKLNEAGGTIEFEVNPGLAATYLLRFRYMNYSEESIPMQLELINALNGVQMLKETIWFEPADEKWRIMSTTTGSQINAGTYKIRMTVLDQTGIEFDSFEFE